MVETAKGDIETFNEYVLDQRASLLARGETTSDLVMNLFRAYGKVGNDDFKHWLGRRKDEYDEGKDFNEDEFMHSALIKYKTLKEQGNWSLQSSAQESIIALTAQIKELEGKLKAEKKGNKGNQRRTQRDKQKLTRRQKRQMNVDDWKLQPPTDNQKTKTVDDKKYFWCPNHNDGKGQWVRHAPTECKGKRKSNKKDEDKNHEKTKGVIKQDKKVTFATTMAALLESDSDSE
jgi:hypothetical protein